MSHKPETTQSKNPQLVFFCQFCGRRLAVDTSNAGSIGPCPSCGNWLTAPVPLGVSPLGISPLLSAPPGVAPVAAPPPDKTAASTRRGGGVRADINMDSAHQERREMGETMMLIAMVVIVFSICALVFYFLQDWGAR